MKFEAMNTAALAAVVNSMRPVTAAHIATGYVNQKVRGMVAMGKLTPAEAIEAGTRINLSREGVVKVLLSFSSHGVANRVRQAIGVVPHEIAGALAPAHAAPVQTHGPVVVTRVAPLPTLTIAETDGVQTMSSLDMVAYINATREAGKAELQHKHFLAKVPSVIGYSMSAKFLAHIEIAGPNGGTRRSPVYNFPRREAMLMAMSYSYKLQATVYDAWQAAEAKAAPAAPVVAAPVTPTTYLDALKQLVASVEVNEAQALQITNQAVQIEAAAPAVAFVARYVSAEGRYTFREVAKILDAKQADFRAFLVEKKIQYKNNNGYLPHEIHKAEGRFVVQPIIDKAGYARSSVYFTPKGVEWITKRWNAFLKGE